MIAAWILKMLPYRWAFAFAGVCAAFGGLYLTYEHWAGVEQAKGAAPWIKAVNDQKVESASKLAVLQAQADALTQDHINFMKARNENDQVSEGALSILADKLAAGRLHDPYQAGCGSSGSSPTGKETGSAAAGATDAAPAGGELSAEFDGFLKQKAKSADSINAAYASCRSSLYEAVK